MLSIEPQRCRHDETAPIPNEADEHTIGCSVIATVLRERPNMPFLCHKHSRFLVRCVFLLCVLVLMPTSDGTILGAAAGDENASLPHAISTTALRCRLEQLEVKGDGSTSFSVTVYNSGLHPLYLDVSFFNREAVGALVLFPVDSSYRLQLRWCLPRAPHISVSQAAKSVQIGPDASVTLTVSWTASRSSLWNWKRLESPSSIQAEEDVMRGEVVNDLSGLHVAAQLRLLVLVSSTEDLAKKECVYVPCDSVKWLRIAGALATSQRADNEDPSRTGPERSQEVGLPPIRSESGAEEKKRDPR
jgi:hypothetical protein